MDDDFGLLKRLKLFMLGLFLEGVGLVRYSEVT